VTKLHTNTTLYSWIDCIVYKVPTYIHTYTFTTQQLKKNLDDKQGGRPFIRTSHYVRRWELRDRQASRISS